MKVRGLFAPLTAAVLLAGGARVSQAQVNFTNTNTDLNFVSVASGTPLVISSGNSVTVNYATTGDSYRLNGAGALDASQKDAAGLGAFIRLSAPAPIGGLYETSTQNTTFNVSAINYRFDTTILDADSGQSAIVSTFLTFNNRFREGSNGGDVVTNLVLPANTVIGQNTYAFSAFNFTPASAPPTTGGTSPVDGAFGLRVMATAPAPVPEPGTVAMLVGMGVSGSAFVMRRRRAVK